MTRSFDAFSLTPDVASASIARDRVRAWLARHDWPDDQTHDLVYAVSEAVTNAAEHAFRPPPIAPMPRAADSGSNGAPSIRIECRARCYADRPEGGTAGGPGCTAISGGEIREMQVTVTDNGRWKPTDPDRGHRGHGLTLCAALIDSFHITTSDAGTTVELTSRTPAQPSPLEDTMRSPSRRGSR